MHPKKQKKRGFNQSELLAKDIAKELNLPCKKLLVKTKNNDEQHNCASLAQRRENVKGVYKAVKDETIKGKTILIIDDILTTGYTLGECAKTLEKYTHSKILCATVCAKNNIYT
jgi:predicted amidophosphoribosyltransferase